MLLRFSDLAKDDIERSGKSRKNAGNRFREDERLEKLSLVTES